MERFSEETLPTLYDRLARKDKHFKKIIADHGYPPLWVRPNTFETLVLTILEQQVSLASAYAAYQKLKACIDITPKHLLQLSDEDLRACYFSRQKISYARGLATALLEKKIGLASMEDLPDDTVRAQLKTLKGIGDWTVDIYLIHVLRRTDVFPLGDIALVNAIRMVHQLPEARKEDLLALSEKWKPLRTMATMLFWHYYIIKKNIRILH